MKAVGQWLGILFRYWKFVERVGSVFQIFISITDSTRLVYCTVPVLRMILQQLTIDYDRLFTESRRTSILSLRRFPVYSGTGNQ